MRIAVCRPQVPFVYGGAEVMADTLAEELRARGHEAEVVTVPYKWYPGTRVLDQAFLWRLLDLEEADGRPIDRVIATKFPAYCVRHPNKVAWIAHQFRQAYDYDRSPEFGQFSESPKDRATRLAVERLDRIALGEARKVFAISQNVVERLAQYTGVEATYLPPPPQKLPYRTAEPEPFVLSVNRLDRAKRIDLLIEAAKLDSSLRIVVTGDGPDRERLERLASPLNGQIEFTGRVDDERLADLYARCLAVFYAPVDEDYGMVPFEAFLSEKPVVTTTDAGGPLEIVRDRETGVVVAPEPHEVAAACAYLGGHVDDAKAWGRAGKAVAERVTWDACIDALLLVKVAYYSPLAPSRSGIADYSALLLPALRERVSEVVVAEPGKRAPGADVTLYHVGNDPDSHGWIVDALRKRPGVVALHESVLHHLIAGITIGRGKGRAYLDAMERDGGVAGRLLGLGVLDNLLPLLWETEPERFPLTGSVVDLADGLIVHSRYVETRARAAGYAGRLWRVPHPAWPVAAPAPADVAGDPLVGCFGYLNMNKRIPQLLEAFALLLRRRPGARLLLVGAAAERFELERRFERLGLGGDALIRMDYVPEERLWSLMAACDVLVNLRSPTMGETSGAVIRGLSLGKAMLVSDVGWFAELPDGVALRIPVDEHEVATIAAALELAADRKEELGAAAQAYVRREHDLGRVADAYVRALEEAAGGDAVADAVLWRIAEVAADVGLEDVTELAARAREAGLVG